MGDFRGYKKVAFVAIETLASALWFYEIIKILAWIKR